MVGPTRAQVERVIVDCSVEHGAAGQEGEQVFGEGWYESRWQPSSRRASEVIRPSLRRDPRVGGHLVEAEPASAEGAWSVLLGPSLLDEDERALFFLIALASDEVPCRDDDSLRRPRYDVVDAEVRSDEL